MKTLIEIAKETRAMPFEEQKAEYAAEVGEHPVYKITIEGPDGIPHTVETIAAVILTAPTVTDTGGGTSSFLGDERILQALICMLPEMVDNYMGKGMWEVLEKLRKAYDLSEVV
jgi:hypothetical protein